MRKALPDDNFVTFVEEERSTPPLAEGLAGYRSIHIEDSPAMAPGDNVASADVPVKIDKKVSTGKMEGQEIQEFLTALEITIMTISPEGKMSGYMLLSIIIENGDVLPRNVDLLEKGGEYTFRFLSSAKANGSVRETEGLLHSKHHPV